MTKLPQRPHGPPQSTSGKVVFEQVGITKHGHRAVLYGSGGVGKSTLACMLPGKTAFVDADDSLEKLKASLAALSIDLPVKVKVSDWLNLRSALQSSGWDGIDNIVLDTWDPIECWNTDHTLATVKKDDGKSAIDMEDYGFGKGYRRTYDHFIPLLGDLDRHVRQGRNVIIISHDEICKVPNPAGQDFIRWEPRMQHTEKASIRLKFKAWADHVLFLSYDMEIQRQAGDFKGVKHGRAQGGGSRTLYTAELPHFMAKSRTTSDSFDIKPGESPWPSILK